MPQFVNSPFQKPVLAQKGVAAYLIGSFSQLVGSSRLAVTNVAIASNVATVLATPLEGPGPAVGSLITIVNTTTGAGEFNVARVAVATASYSATTNLWTITFALTGSNVGPVADFGTVVIEPAEVGETVSGTYTSVSALIAAPEGDSQFTLPLSVVAPPASITAMTATLQVALKQQSNEWTNTATVVTIASAAYTKGPVVEATLERGYLYRLAITGVTGSGSVVAKIGG